MNLSALQKFEKSSNMQKKIGKKRRNFLFNLPLKTHFSVLSYTEKIFLFLHHQF